MLILGFDRFEFEELFPELCFRQCRTKEDFFLFDGVHKYQVKGMEVDARIGIVDTVQVHSKTVFRSGE